MARRSLILRARWLEFGVHRRTQWLDCTIWHAGIWPAWSKAVKRPLYNWSQFGHAFEYCTLLAAFSRKHERLRQCYFLALLYVWWHRMFCSWASTTSDLREGLTHCWLSQDTTIRIQLTWCDCQSLLICCVFTRIYVRPSLSTHQKTLFLLQVKIGTFVHGPYNQVKLSNLQSHAHHLQPTHSVWNSIGLSQRCK
jgi:hypothetical protein